MAMDTHGGRYQGRCFLTYIYSSFGGPIASMGRTPVRPYPKNCWEDSSHLKPSAVRHTAEAPISRQEALPALACVRQDNGRSGAWCRQVPLCCQADGHTLLKRLTAVLHPRNSTLLSTATSSESNPVYPSQALCNGPHAGCPALTA